MKKLTNTQTLKNLNEPCRYQIEGVKGLSLLVQASSTGSLRKYFVFRFTLGKRYDMSIGVFPEISLAEAKAKAEKMRGLVLNGINPVEQRNSARSPVSPAKGKLTFKEFASNYLDRMRPQWKNAKHIYQWDSTIQKYMIPVIGELGLNEIRTEHVIQILEPIWLQKYETASRTRSRLERIISAAIATGLRTEPNCASWRGHLNQILPNAKPRVEHFRAVPYIEIPELFLQLQKYGGASTLALQFTILCAARTGETINALRSEVVDGVWQIPPEKMKMGRMHVVPLSQQALRLIEEARKLDPNSKYLFSRKGSPLSSHAMLMLFRKVRPNFTVHGTARSSFADWASD